MNKITYIFSFVLAALGILLASASSPLVPTNLWVDTNCFLTVGRAIADGQVVYRDIFEQKGVLLYFIYAGASVISDTSFLGVYVFETIALFILLVFMAKIIQLFDAHSLTVFALLPLITVVVLTTGSFSQGGSAEEFCMPLCAISLYHLLGYYFGDEPYTEIKAFLDGFLCACVFWIKFSLIGLHLGCFLALLLGFALNREFDGFWKKLASVFLGATCATLPWFVYFSAHGALSDWLYGYIITNIFGYQEPMGIIDHLYSYRNNLLSAIHNNQLMLTLSLVGLTLPAHKSAETIRAKKGHDFCLMFPFLILFLGVYIGSKAYPYYAYIFAVFSIFGLIWIYLSIKKILGAKLASMPKRYGPAFVALTCSLSLLLLYQGANCSGYRQFSEEDYPQYQFAEIIRSTEDATLLNYGFLDGGFYLASGVLPSTKYFCTLNNESLAEMYDEMSEVIEKGTVDYVITRNDQPDSLNQNYTLVATSSFDGLTYYLYAKN